MGPNNLSGEVQTIMHDLLRLHIFSDYEKWMWKSNSIYLSFFAHQMLFNFAAWVGFCRTSVTKGGQTGDFVLENWHLIIYAGTLLHNDQPDILVFTDNQIDERKAKGL